MKLSEVVRRLIDIAESDGPRVQRAAGLSGDVGGCVFMTVIGCDVLRRFGLRAEPYPVRIIGQNARYRAWQSASADSPTPKPADAYAFTDRGFYQEVNGPEGLPAVREGELKGHLMIHLPDAEKLIDLDLRQFSNPERGFELPAVICLDWPTGKSGCGWNLPDGGLLLIRYMPDDYGSRTSGLLEFGTERARLVPPIVRAIVDNTPLDLSGI